MRFAMIVTAVLFVAWLATLGVRVSTRVPAVADDSSPNSAAVLEAVQDGGPLGN